MPIENFKQEVDTTDQKDDEPMEQEPVIPASIGKFLVEKEVTETFTDEDGMLGKFLSLNSNLPDLVTRVVKKMIEVDKPVDQKPVVPLKPKNNINPPKPAPKLPSNQKSISSFFKKA